MKKYYLGFVGVSLLPSILIIIRHIFKFNDQPDPNGGLGLIVTLAITFPLSCLAAGIGFFLLVYVKS